MSFNWKVVENNDLVKDNNSIISYSVRLVKDPIWTTHTSAKNNRNPGYLLLSLTFSAFRRAQSFRDVVLKSNLLIIRHASNHVVWCTSSLRGYICWSPLLNVQLQLISSAISTIQNTLDALSKRLSINLFKITMKTTSTLRITELPWGISIS